MSQVFHPSMNTFSRASIFGAAFIVVGLLFLFAAIQRSPWMTGVGVAIDQPVPFSHAHHVDGLGIDCRYCHTSVEKGPFAGIPSTHTCMGCHSRIWSDSPVLEPVRESYRTGEPLRWTRVHDLPDYVYFDHSIHVARGIGCRQCHGRVDRMPLTWKAETLHMEWCLACHVNPQVAIGPRERVFDLAWEPTAPEREAIAASLMEQWDVRKPTSCSACHR